MAGKNLVEKNVTIRGDLHRPDLKAPVVSVGFYCIFEESSFIYPPARKLPISEESALSQEQAKAICPETGKIHFPIKIGSYVYVGQGTRLEAAQIGNNVYIGKNCTIGEFANIKDCVIIEDGTVVPPYVTVSPFSRISGEPSLFIEELPESTEHVLEMYCRKVYAGIDMVGPPL